jgi:uncharacterized DUF497 family protein
MEQEMVYAPSAFKHGIDGADIEHAPRAHITDELMAGFDNKYFVIGYDRAGNPLEVIYNRIDEAAIKVFHAMKCRRHFRDKFGI